MPSHDVMPNMELYQPVQVEDALEIANRYADRGWLVGGGQDTYGWLKDRAKSADALIDLSAIGTDLEVGFLLLMVLRCFGVISCTGLIWIERIL